MLQFHDDASVFIPQTLLNVLDIAKCTNSFSFRCNGSSSSTLLTGAELAGGGIRGFIPESKTKGGVVFVVHHLLLINSLIL